MKILPIINLYDNTNSNMAKKNAQSFKGLMGNTENDFRVDSQGIRNEWSSTDYHPFLGESQSEIDKTVRRNSGSAIDDAGSTITSHYLEVKERLPFTKGEYERFQRGELQRSYNKADRAIADVIERTISKLHLG